MEDIDKEIASLEMRAIASGLSGATPGTAIQRALMDTKLARAEGIAVPANHTRESILVWSFSLGGLMAPKWFIRDVTIRGCICQAQILLDGIESKTAAKNTGRPVLVAPPPLSARAKRRRK